MEHKDNIIWHRGERVFLTGRTEEYRHGLRPLYQAKVLTGIRAGKFDWISEEHLIQIGAI